MVRQQFAGFLHTVDDAGGEFGAAKIFSHGLGEFAPEGLAALGMDGFITVNGKLVGARCHENEDGIAFGAFMQALAQKFGLCGCHRFIDVFGTDADADLAGGFEFGIANGGDNAVVMQMFGEGVRVHNLPAPSRAAAAATAAAAGKPAAATTAKTSPAAPPATTATPTTAGIIPSPPPGGQDP
jgi:hypothetical protein